MALTQDFKVTVRERLQRDPFFRNALLKEAADCLLASDVETGKSLVRDYVKATMDSQVREGALRSYRERETP